MPKGDTKRCGFHIFPGLCRSHSRQALLCSRYSVFYHRDFLEHRSQTSSRVYALLGVSQSPGFSECQPHCLWSLLPLLEPSLQQDPGWKRPLRLAYHRISNITPFSCGLQNETASNTILQDMRNYLQSLPFQFQNASIISGEEEGLYGWITVNYLMNNFLERDLWNSWVRPHGAKTVGSLDLGGASTQIAFTTTDDAMGEGLTKVTLYGYDYTVYTHSFLCFGKNEAEKTVLAKFVQGSTDLNNVQNPCYPVGFNITMTEEFIFGSECTKDLRISNYSPERNITIFGGGDAAECRNAVRQIFNLSSCDGSQNCSFNGVYQPPVSGQFMAYAGFYYTAWALKLVGAPTLDKFNSTLWSFCSMDWTKLKRNYNINEKHLKSYCYSANYVYTILVDGYKFNTASWNDIRFERQVKNTSIAWTLGYMLTLSNMIPAEAKHMHLPMENTLFAGILFLFSALTIIALVFLIILLIRTCY
ncbi:ectonucleoside triphosphate diphosphohydrolase 3 isoform X2 [Alosa sapidissima]|uniref:ectonucleoside triphosphate diphosphohydrolase 3 isoform X2 n=1 Tax=Alosa sapidissima TaxID=34773 RepID=UPI001C08BFDE|nr:ectonucleoside triphosphate diphosphohydrolase 3 isoform X2 [Alosa sapidissima]